MGNQSSNPADNSTQPVPDYNSMQPQSNPLGAVSDTPVPAPTPMDTSAVDALAGSPTEESMPAEAPMPAPESPVSETSASTPATDTVQGILDSFPSSDTPAPSEPAVSEPAPSIEEPSAASGIDINGSPIIGSVPPAETPSSDTFSSAPVQTDIPAPSAPESMDSSPVKEEMPIPDSSLNLNEPLSSAVQSSPVQENAQPQEEVVSTLDDEEEKDKKGSNVVVIILVIIILLLLAGIGYFGYQIFLA